MEDTTQNNQTALDPHVVALAKAIRQVESGGNYNAKGGSGEHGAYQYTEGTWNSDAKRYGVNVPLKEATLEQQNEVAYKKILDLKKQGHNPGEIASIWNSGKPKWEGNVGVNKFGVHYDTPAYVDKVTKEYQKIKPKNQEVPVEQNISAPADNQGAPEDNSGAWFPSSPTDTPLEGVAKTAGNLIPSAVNFGKGAISTLNPISIAENIGQMPGLFGGLAKESGGVIPAIGNFLKEVPGAAYQTLVPQGIRELISGDTASAGKTLTNDPFGTWAPVVLGAKGAAEGVDAVAGKLGATTDIGGALDKGIERTAKVVTKPASVATGAIGNVAGKVFGTLASKITSLDPSTIRQVLSNPEEFTRMAQEQASRGGLAGEVKDNINKRLRDLETTGKGYDAVRAQLVPVTSTLGYDFGQILEKNGLKLDPNGQIIAGPDSITRNPADIRAVQNFLDNWLNQENPTPSQFLNLRSDLADLAKYDRMSGKTSASEVLAKQMRDRANAIVRPLIPGLEALDAQYSPEVKFLKQIKKDYLNPDGTFKDNAVNKIANAGNKSELLKRLEEVSPGVTKRLQILKAVEDIQHANGIKVGGYTRSLLEGASILSGNIPGLIATIITHPTMAVQILRRAGIVGAKVGPILKALNVIGGQVGAEPQGLMPALIQQRISQKSGA